MGLFAVSNDFYTVDLNCETSYRAQERTSRGLHRMDLKYDNSEARLVQKFFPDPSACFSLQKTPFSLS